MKLFSYFIIMSVIFFHSICIFAADVPVGIKLADKQVLNRGNGAEIATIDPQLAEDMQSFNVAMDLFESLVRENSDGEIIPAGATSWSVSTNGLLWTFHLRENAKWSNGEKVTAQDYVYGMQRLIDPKIASTYSFLLSAVKNADVISQGKMPLTSLGVEALDELTLQITLNNPVPYMLEILALRNCAPANKKAMEKFAAQYFQANHIVTNGAYKLKYWGVGDKVTLIKNSNYWNADKTVIEEVNYYPTQNLNSEGQMFLSNQLDMTFNISIDQFKSLKEKLGRQVYSSPYLSSCWLDFNLQQEPFKNNLSLRKALNMVIDRDVLTKNILGRGEKIANDPIPHGVRNYNSFQPEWDKLSYQERVAQAKKLYNDAGYSSQKPLSITILYGTNENDKKVILAVASMWRSALGVQVKLENQEWKVFLTNLHKRDFQIAWVPWIADYNDASTFADLLRSDSPMNSSGYVSAKYDELLKKSSIEQNSEKRKKLLQQASAVAMNDYPIIPLYSAVTAHLVKTHVGGYTGNNPLDHVSTFDLYLKE